MPRRPKKSLQDCQETFYDGESDVEGLGAGDSTYVSSLLDEKEMCDLFEALNCIKYVPRGELTVKIFGKTQLLPRDKQFFGTHKKNGTVPHYRYGGSYVPTILPFSSELQTVVNLLAKEYNQLCNHAVVNRYVGGSVPPRQSSRFCA